MLVLTRPSRWLVRAVIVMNVAFIGVWAWSRTAGLPIGAHANHPEAAGFVDLACVGFEAALVLLAAVLLVRPDAGRRWSPGALVAASILPVGVLVLATAAVASPSATSHGHGDHAADTAGGEHAHAGAGAATGDHAHDAGATDGHDHARADGATPANGASGAAADDKGLSLIMNGHQHAAGEVPIDAATQATLDHQLDQTRALAARYPDIARAEAAGYRRAGPFSPALGTHYVNQRDFEVNTSGVMDDAALAHPVLIYDGTDQTSKLTGFMYLAYRDGEPEGFAGPNDHWHFHTNVCMVADKATGTIDTPLGADTGDVSKELCDTYGGSLVANTGYMVHVWTVPGYESSRGVFSEVNPKVTCPDGTYHRIPLEKIEHRLTTCPQPGDAVQTAAPGSTAAAAAGHDHGGGLAGQDEAAELEPDVPLDDATRARVGEQLVEARAAAARYPTVGDAKRAGLVLAGGNAPGVGAHYQQMSAETLKALNPDGTVNAGHPSTYIYGGTLDDAPLVGLMYSSLTDEAPEGFAGPNDHWHRHSNLCLTFDGGQINVPFPPDRDVTRAQCDGVKGRFLEKTVWMVHAWVVPGWESPQGVFSHANPNVHCRDGSDDVDAVGFCIVP